MASVDAMEGEHPSRFVLASWLAEELAPASRLALEQHFQGCERCRSIAQAARLEADAFAARHPEYVPISPAPEKAAVGPHPRAPRRGWSEAWEAWGFGGRSMPRGLKPAWTALAMLAATGALWTFTHRGGEDLIAKGGTRFTLFLKGKPVRSDTLACAPADTLQLAVVSGAPVHYAILFRDDAGPIRPYIEGEGADQNPLGNPGGVALPHSLVLDNGWRAETVYCVWSPQAFTLSQAMAAAAAEAPSSPLSLQKFHLVNRSP